jgi:hypothetical protein
VQGDSSTSLHKKQRASDTRYATTPPVEITKCFTDHFNILTYFSKELRVLPDDDQ